MERLPGSFSILVVCDGNVCRSPSAHFELLRRLPGVRVESAGMHALAGASLCAVASVEIAAAGATADDFARDFRSRKLRDVDVREFDITLAATTGLRADLARAHPGLRDRFFTLLEAADVLTEVLLAHNAAEPVSRSQLVDMMNQNRGARPALERLSPKLHLKIADPLDIPDAHGDRVKRHRAVVGMAQGAAAAFGDAFALLTIK